MKPVSKQAGVLRMNPDADVEVKEAPKPPARKGRRAAPTPCPIKLDADPGKFFKANKFGPDTTSLMMYALCCVYKSVRADKGFPETIPGINASHFDGNLTNEDKDWIELVNEDRACWIEYCYDLIACFQVKPLEVQNVASYFAATGSVYKPTNALVAMISWVANSIQKVNISGLRDDMASWNPFVDYHTRAFSSASLVIRFQDTFPDVMKELFPDVDMEKIQEIEDNAWDLSESYRLPDSLLGVISIWVTLSGIIKNPNRWYQGEKARGKMGRRELLAWEQFFVREEKMGLPDFAAFDKIDDMIGAMTEKGFSKRGVKVKGKMEEENEY